MSEVHSDDRPTRSTSGFINRLSAVERKAHMAELGRRSQATRLTLSAEERAGLVEAYRLLSQIARRHGIDAIAPAEGGAGDA